MKTVTKKIIRVWFDKIIDSKKKFELRLADFDIKAGDVLKLDEYTGIDKDRVKTGRSTQRVVKYVEKVNIKDWIKKQPELLKNGFYVIQFD